MFGRRAKVKSQKGSMSYFILEHCWKDLPEISEAENLIEGLQLLVFVTIYYRVEKVSIDVL